MVDQHRRARPPAVLDGVEGRLAFCHVGVARLALLAEPRPRRIDLGARVRLGQPGGGRRARRSHPRRTKPSRRTEEMSGLQQRSRSTLVYGSASAGVKDVGRAY